MDWKSNDIWEDLKKNADRIEEQLMGVFCDVSSWKTLKEKGVDTSSLKQQLASAREQALKDAPALLEKNTLNEERFLGALEVFPPGKEITIGEVVESAINIYPELQHKQYSKKRGNSLKQQLEAELGSQYLPLILSIQHHTCLKACLMKSINVIKRTIQLRKKMLY